MTIVPPQQPAFIRQPASTASAVGLVTDRIGAQERQQRLERDTLPLLIETFKRVFLGDDSDHSAHTRRPWYTSACASSRHLF
jgi:hypothetical protein